MTVPDVTPTIAPFPATPIYPIPLQPVSPTPPLLTSPYWPQGAGRLNRSGPQQRVANPNGVTDSVTWSGGDFAVYYASSNNYTRSGSNFAPTGRENYLTPGMYNYFVISPTADANKRVLFTQLHAIPALHQPLPGGNSPLGYLVDAGVLHDLYFEEGHTVYLNDFSSSASVGTLSQSLWMTNASRCAGWFLQYLRDMVLARHSANLLAQSNAAAGLANSAITTYNSMAATVIGLHNAQATMLNNHPAYANPYTFATATLDAYLATVNGIVNGLLILATNTVAAAQAEANRIKATTVDPTVQQALDLANATLTQVTAIVNAQVTAVMTAVTNAKAIADQQIAILNAEYEKQKTAAEARVTEEQRKAAAAIDNAVATALNLGGSVIVTVNGLVTAVMDEFLRVQAQLVAQTQDRPLFHGALTSPVTISGPTDVVVIPPGGLVITAD